MCVCVHVRARVCDVFCLLMLLFFSPTAAKSLLNKKADGVKVSPSFSVLCLSISLTGPQQFHQYSHHFFTLVWLLPELHHQGFHSSLVPIHRVLDFGFIRTSIICVLMFSHILTYLS